MNVCRPANTATPKAMCYMTRRLSSSLNSRFVIAAKGSGLLSAAVSIALPRPSTEETELAQI